MMRMENGKEREENVVNSEGSMDGKKSWLRGDVPVEEKEAFIVGSRNIEL